ncbi:unnamed protein product [Prunus brigantina]
MRDLVLALHSAGGVILRELCISVSGGPMHWFGLLLFPLSSSLCFRNQPFVILLCSDIPMAQFIINYNNTLPPSQQFIIHVLDSTHLFVQPHAAEMIRSAISEFRDQNSYEKPT